MNELKIEEQKTGVVVSPSQIQYTFVTPHIAFKYDEFFDQAYAILRECPKDLLQLRDSVDFFQFCF